MGKTVADSESNFLSNFKGVTENESLVAAKEILRT